MTPGQVFPARYDGTCAAECGHRIHPGDPVRYDDDDQLRHDQCTPKRSKFDIGPREVVCPDCFCIRPCRCLD